MNRPVIAAVLLMVVLVAEVLYFEVHMPNYERSGPAYRNCLALLGVGHAMTAIQGNPNNPFSLVAYYNPQDCLAFNP